jgi:hypothetical protein
MGISCRRRFALLLGGALMCSAAAASSVRAEVTTLGGAAYAGLCQSRGVPLPPKWGTSAWKFNGSIGPQDTFIVRGKKANVYYATSSQGLCMALPRSAEGSGEVTKAAFGVICQSNSNGKVCFWDNAGTIGWDDRNGTTVFSEQVVIASTTPSELDGRFIGGADLAPPHPGGPCTDCHTGRNPYIVVPGFATDLRPAGVSQDSPVWYDGILPAVYPQNTGPGTPLDGIAVGTGEGNCLSCHNDGGFGGKFPNVGGTNTTGYCNAVIEKARDFVRMPPPIEGLPSLSWDKHWDALFAKCKLPVTSAVPSPRFALDPALAAGVAFPIQ